MRKVLFPVKLACMWTRLPCWSIKTVSGEVARPAIDESARIASTPPLRGPLGAQLAPRTLRTTIRIRLENVFATHHEPGRNDRQYPPKARSESPARRRVRFPSFSQVNACFVSIT
ncbi:hypothetical protein C8Q74DRAFT_13032 [Fomes fomentarius]|nr:hypothetical protein C8Q74DRAFT_13032 [Fomes fomentarius]